MAISLINIIKPLNVTSVSGDPWVEFSSVAYDSRRVKPGALFVAIKGHQEDGRRYVASAIKAGAVAIMTDSPLTIDYGLPVVMVPDAREALALAASELYGRPGEKMITAGVTGTKGKTTTSFLIKAILDAADIKSGLMGTIKISYAGIDIPADITTPEGSDIQCHLARMVEAGVSHSVVEVSSHALALSRVAGCYFDVAVFTNLGRDHLEYHGDLDSYFEAKKILFEKHLTGENLENGPKAIINIDDEHGRKLADTLGVETITYSIAGSADLTAKEIKTDSLNLSAEISTPGGAFQVSTSLVGKINIYNMLAATGAALAMGISIDHIRAGLESIPGVPGRLERVGGNDDYLALIDYAHTAEALEETLSSVKELAPKRLFTVFGCGGDRDKAKRSLMGQAAGSYSNLAIATSDNPRTEDPLEIISQVEVGLKNRNLSRWVPGEQNGDYPSGSYAVVPDRREAIKLGVRLMKPGDILVVAGKGHEDYQIIGHDKIHLDDREETLAALRMEGKA